jgi:hypothetical protein
VLPFHECAAEPLQAVVESITDPAAAKSTTEPLHDVADLAADGVAPTETSCFCVRV